MKKSFIKGMPCFPETQHSEYGDLWKQTLRKINQTIPWKNIMGPSVHTKTLADGRVVPKLYRED